MGMRCSVTLQCVITCISISVQNMLFFEVLVCSMGVDGGSVIHRLYMTRMSSRG